MITDKIENIQKYSSLFQNISKLVAILNNHPLDSFLQKESFDDIVIILLKSEGVSDSFNPFLLEAHITTMDIHITLDGIDVIAYSDLESEAKVTKEYDELNDYLLASSEDIKSLIVPKGYFCIIPNNFAHMAMYAGHQKVKKFVIKLPVKH